MNDRDDPKIVSLDQRRRADAARQKAELAAAAKRTKTNGSGRPLNQPFGQPKAGPRPGGSFDRFVSALGVALAWIVWGGLLACAALAAWGWLAAR